MNEHRLHAESALAEAARSEPGSPAWMKFSSIASVHATLALAHETEEVAMAARGEVRASPEPPAAPAPPPPASIAARESLEHAREVWEASARDEGDALIFRRTVDEVIGLLGGSPF